MMMSPGVLSLRKQFLSSLSRAELKDLAERQQAKLAELAQRKADLQAALAQLKGCNRPPAPEPSGLEAESGAKPADAGQRPGRKRRKT